MRRRQLACCVVLASALSAVSFAAPPSANSPTYQKAVDALKAKRFKDARDLFAALAANPAEASRALHGRGVCELYLDDVKAAKASLEQAVKLAGAPDRVLTYNYAIALSKTDALATGGDSIRKYLFAQPEPLDEPLLSALGTVLQMMADKQDSNTKSRGELQAFYNSYNERVERAYPGMRRWGDKWESDDAFAEHVKARQELATRSDVIRKDLALIRDRVAGFRQELARNRKQGGGVRRTGDMDRKMSESEDELKQKTVEFQQVNADLKAAEPRFTATLFPLPLDAAVPPPVGDAPAAVAESPTAPVAPTVPTAPPSKEVDAAPATPKPEATAVAPVAPTPAAPKPATDDGVTGHAYAVIEQAMNFEAAKRRCVELGGSLVTIESEKENAFVQRQLAARGANQNYWIGLAAPRPNAFKWVNGRPVIYKHWGKGEPNEKAGAIGVGMWSDSADWTDEPPTNRSMFVCEWTDASKVPADTDSVVAEAGLLDGTVPHEVQVPANGGMGSRACSLGKFKRGQRLMIQYVQGEWSAFPRQGLGSPDDVPLHSNVLPVSLCQVVNGQVTKIMDIPGNTAGEPFEYVIDKPNELVLNMQDPSPNNNAGTVTYKVWIKP